METNKELRSLIILSIFDHMNIPLDKDLLTVIVTENNWMTLIDLVPTLTFLKKSDLIIKSNQKSNKEYFVLSSKGKECLETMEKMIPLPLRNSISQKINEQRLYYRLREEYFADYKKALDGTYNVRLVINGTSEPLLDITINVPTRTKAKWIYETWPAKAPAVSETLFDLLTD